jgi:hypothetical protein
MIEQQQMSNQMMHMMMQHMARGGGGRGRRGGPSVRRIKKYKVHAHHPLFQEAIVYTHYMCAQCMRGHHTLHIPPSERRLRGIARIDLHV